MKVILIGFSFIVLFFSSGFIYSETLSAKIESLKEQNEKKERVNKSSDVFNEEANKTKKEIELLLAKIKNDPEDQEQLYEDLKNLKNNLKMIEKSWFEWCQNEFSQNDSSNYWNQYKITLKDLLDYYAYNDLYLIPEELQFEKFSFYSSVPWMKESWDSLLEVILLQRGIGVRSLKPHVKQLYKLKDGLGFSAIVSHAKELDLFIDNERLCWIMPEGHYCEADLQEILKEYSQNKECDLRVIQGNYLIFGPVKFLREIAELISFLNGPLLEKRIEFFSTQSITPSQVKFLLEESCLYLKEKVHMIPLDEKKILIVAASPKFICQVSEFIESLTAHCSQQQLKRLFTYRCRFANPQKLAELVSQFYGMLRGTQALVVETKMSERSEDKLVVSPDPVSFQSHDSVHNPSYKNHQQVIVDPITGTLIMAIEEEFIGEVKSLLNKLDLPQKMVKIDVLLVEKRMSGQQRFGLNLLNIGSNASQTNVTGGSWQTIATPGFSSSGVNTKGIVHFFMSREESSQGRPPYDLAYHFLIAQEDLQINANPSLLTMNQIPASIDLVDEISVSTGVEEISTANNGVVLKNSFVRSQYGIHIEITPMVHPYSFNEDHEQAVITLKTHINFDTQRSNRDNRPDVFRRQIHNEVRIGNGETIVIGGLKQKDSQNENNIIPFLGELPGLGKLFGSKELSDFNTEMFIFITPKIIESSQEEFNLWKQQQLSIRPGDQPELTNYLLQSEEEEKKRVFHSSLKMLMGN